MVKQCIKCKKQLSFWQAYDHIDDKLYCIHCSMKLKKKEDDKVEKTKTSSQLKETTTDRKTKKKEENQCVCGNNINSNTVLCMKCGSQVKKLKVDITDNPWMTIGFKQFWGVVLITVLIIFILIYYLKLISN